MISLEDLSEGWYAEAEPSGSNPSDYAINIKEDYNVTIYNNNFRKSKNRHIECTLEVRLGYSALSTNGNATNSDLMNIDYDRKWRCVITVSIS